MSKENLDKPILITGSNSGIGRKALELLLKEGYFVYAGVRKEEDLQELNKLPNTLAIKLDVTNEDQIKTAVQIIKKEGRGLYGLVNNAGIAEVGPMITSSIDMMKNIFEVNVFGPHRMVLACLPFLKQPKGRIVNIGSISGILTGRFLGLYSMSKHALEAYSDSLIQDAVELGMYVSIIEPGNFKSDIGKNMYERMKKEQEGYRINMTDNQRKQQFKEVEKHFLNDQGFPEPDLVAKAILDAISSEKPKPRYLVTTKDETIWVLQRMFGELFQLNHNHVNTHSREELISIMDETYKLFIEKYGG